MRDTTADNNRENTNKRRRARLWIGGTSALAQTYWNAFLSSRGEDDHWIFLGRQLKPPEWMAAAEKNIDFTYSSLDLSQYDSNVTTAIHGITSQYNIVAIVIGVRPPLLTSKTHSQNWKECDRLLNGLEYFLKSILQEQASSLGLILHISSIAAVDHLKRQHLYSIALNPPVASSNLQQPYDRFKRRSEELVEEIVKEQQQLQDNRNVRFTNLRCGAIFSDSPACIQCNAMQLQLYAGPYLPTPIDCNSGKNVASMIHIILSEGEKKDVTLRPYYFYTRPLLLTQPVPYGDYLVQYRLAYNVRFPPLFLPNWIVKWCFIQPLHWLCCLLPSVPFLQSVDYLMQVTNEEHTFDMTETIQDFGSKLKAYEESIYDCFARRRKRLEQTNNKSKKQNE